MGDPVNAAENAFALLATVTPEKLRQLSKPQLIQVIGDLLAMASQTEKERAQRFECALDTMLKKQRGAKKAKQEREARMLRKDKAWLEERRNRTAEMAKGFERERSHNALQKQFRTFQAQFEPSQEQQEAASSITPFQRLHQPVFQQQLKIGRRRHEAAVKIQRFWRARMMEAVWI